MFLVNWNDFFSWNGWNIIEVFINLFGVIIAGLALWLAYKELSNYKKIKVKVNFKIAYGVVENKKRYYVKAGYNIKVVNCGLSKIYLESIGIDFISNGNEININNSKMNAPGLFFNHDLVILEPGEMTHVYFSELEAALDILKNFLNEKKIKYSSKVYIYVVSTTNQKIHIKTEYSVEELISKTHEAIENSKNKKSKKI